jgi:hypothetical protein
MEEVAVELLLRIREAWPGQNLRAETITPRTAHKVVRPRIPMREYCRVILYATIPFAGNRGETSVFALSLVSSKTNNEPHGPRLCLFGMMKDPGKIESVISASCCR